MDDLVAFALILAQPLLLFLFRRPIARGMLRVVFEVLPREAIANFIEGAMGAYIQKEEVDDGKGKITVKFVATPRLKAMAEVVAPVILAAVMAQLRKVKIDPGQVAGMAQGAGIDLAQVAGSFLGGGGKSKGGLEGMLPGLLQMFMGGGGQGGTVGAKAPMRPGGPPG